MVSTRDDHAIIYLPMRIDADIRHMSDIARYCRMMRKLMHPQSAWPSLIQYQHQNEIPIPKQKKGIFISYTNTKAKKGDSNVRADCSVMDRRPFQGPSPLPCCLGTFHTDVHLMYVHLVESLEVH